MLAPQIISWIIVAIICAASIAIVSLHSYVDANAPVRSGLAPLHITGLAVVICGLMAMAARSITGFDVWFAFFCALSGLSIWCFGLVIAHLRRRVTHEV